MKNIKQINGVPCVLGKVHMLTTNKATTSPMLALQFPDNEDGGNLIMTPSDDNWCRFQHLYFTTDEEGEIGDWMVADNNTIFKVANKRRGFYHYQIETDSTTYNIQCCRKIILPRSSTKRR